MVEQISSRKNTEYNKKQRNAKNAFLFLYQKQKYFRTNYWHISIEGAYEYSDSVDGQTNWSNWTSIPSYYGVNSFTMIGSNTTLSASNPGETETIKHTPSIKT